MILAILLRISDFDSLNHQPPYFSILGKRDRLNIACEPVRKLAFVKTHKTGSSSVANILFRNAIDNRLNVLMTPIGGGPIDDNLLK